MGDFINTLPDDDNVVEQDDIEIVNTLFQNPDKVRTLYNHLRDTLAVIILFIIFSSSIADKIVHKFGVSSHYSVLGIKTIVLAFVFYIVQNRQ